MQTKPASVPVGATMGAVTSGCMKTANALRATPSAFGPAQSKLKAKQVCDLNRAGVP